MAPTTTFCILVSFTAVNAHKTFVQKVPNAWCFKGEEGLGHINPEGGGERNQFGRDFAAQDYKWTTKLCQMDSDGDGVPNGVELGDPCCKWSGYKDDTCTISLSNLSRPGDKTSKPSEPLNCTSATSTEPSSSATSTEPSSSATPVAPQSSASTPSPTQSSAKSGSVTMAWTVLASAVTMGVTILLVLN